MQFEPIVTFLYVYWKGMWHEIFNFVPEYSIEAVSNFSKMRGEIREYLFTGVNNTADKFFTGVVDTGDKTVLPISACLCLKMKKSKMSIY
jgi:hypothetical protein